MTEIEKYGTCGEAIQFRNKYNNFKEAGENCPRGDWMLWIAKRCGVDLQTLILAKALCAKTVIHLMKDQRSIDAVNVAERFGNGQANIDELKAAFNGAYRAAFYADEDDAAACAAYSAASTSYASSNATYTAAAYTETESKKSNKKMTADICRKILTIAVFKKLKIK